MSGPTALLEPFLQHRIELELKDGRTLAGRLLGLDEHLNLVLDEAEESSTDRERRLGRIIVRGSNIVYLSLPDGQPPHRTA